MIMETNINFVEAKMAFIREFMNSTRPADELYTFINAFDTCNPEINNVFAPTVTAAEQDEQPKEELPSARLERRIRSKKRPVIHDGRKPNVHPAAKMVKVTFMDRDTYYGSLKAAAEALHVTYAQVRYAIKYHKTINGQEVSLQDADKVWRNNNKTK